MHFYILNTRPHCRTASILQTTESPYCVDANNQYQIPFIEALKYNTFVPLPVLKLEGGGLIIPNKS